MSQRKRVAVILSGCGVYDGSEIHEAVLTLLALDRAGAEAICAAPDAPQMHVVDHLAGQPTTEARNALVESARIARGKIRSLATLSVDELDAAILPGGFGAAKNLCSYGARGAEMIVEPATEKLLRALHEARRPLGFLCIAPVIAARLFPGCELTIGNDATTAADCVKMGARHVARAVGDVQVDRARRIVSTPAYMLAQSISEVARGADRLAQAVLDLI